MNKSKYMTVAAVAGMVAFLMAADASAGRGRGRGQRGLAGRLAAALELTAEQKIEIQKLKAQMIEELAPAKAELGELRDQMRKLWEADNPSKKKIMAVHAEMDTQRNKIRARKVEFRLDVLNLLTPDQRAKLKQLKAKRGKQRGKRGGGRGNR
ncbi:MAG: periplasmic heavy metal sensor [Deltaproteobacteria bacterium]|nr:periplasmic heavy metal sensor [Deltaproteobacteria bacterium]